METMKLTNKLLAIVMMGAALATAACGGMKTNPVADYPELADSIPAGERKVETQSFISTEFFKIETSGVLNFVQGKKGSYYIKPRLLKPGVEWELTLGEHPEGVTMSKATDSAHAGQYILSWEPQKGMLAPQELERPFKVEFILNVLKVADQRDVELMKLINHPREFPIKVIRTDEQPRVEKVSAQNDKDTVDLGESITFSVIVKDLGSPDERPPHLVAENENNKSNEHVKLEVADNVQIVEKPQALGDGRFKFTAVLNTAGLSLPEKVPAAFARFVLVVVSRSGLPSVDHMVEVKVKRKGVTVINADKNADKGGAQ